MFVLIVSLCFIDGELDQEPEQRVLEAERNNLDNVGPHASI